MPVKPKDAETATPDLGEVAGNIEALSAAELQQALGETQNLVLQQEKLIGRLAEQVEHLSQTALSDTPPPAFMPPDPGPQLREGWKRYGSRFTELTLIKTPGRNIMIDGRMIFQEAAQADFSGGVYETGDPEMQEWLANHADYNVGFWEDPFAIRRHTIVQVSEGVRSTDQTPRAPLTAPMQ